MEELTLVSGELSTFITSPCQKIVNAASSQHLFDQAVACMAGARRRKREGKSGARATRGESEGERKAFPASRARARFPFSLSG